MSVRKALSLLRSDDSGSLLIELVIAMTFIVVAVGALMATYASSMISLHRSGTEGTALTLAFGLPRSLRRRLPGRASGASRHGQLPTCD